MRRHAVGYASIGNALEYRFQAVWAGSANRLKPVLQRGPG